MERLAVAAYAVAGREDLRWPRLISIAGWTLAAFGVAWLVVLSGAPGWASLLALALFWWMPYGIDASRAFMPDPLMTGLLMLSLARLSGQQLPGALAQLQTMDARCFVGTVFAEVAAQPELQHWLTTDARLIEMAGGPAWWRYAVWDLGSRGPCTRCLDISCPLTSSRLTSSDTAGRHTGSMGDAHTMTPQQTRIAELVARGMTNRQIASALGRSPRTVGNTLSRLYADLNIRSRTELAVLMVARATAATAEADVQSEGTRD